MAAGCTSVLTQIDQLQAFLPRMPHDAGQALASTSWLALHQDIGVDTADEGAASVARLTCTPELLPLIPAHVLASLRQQAPAAPGAGMPPQQQTLPAGALLAEVAAAVAGAASVDGAAACSAAAGPGDERLQRCRRLAHELAAVGWHQVRRVSSDLSRLDLELADGAGRRHAAAVQLAGSYPAGGAAASLELPGGSMAAARRQQPAATGANLAHLLAQLQQALQRHQQLWDVLADLDAATRVLEPAGEACEPGGLRGGYGCCYRRLALGGHASLLLTFDPLAPLAAAPDASFMGSEAAVGQLRAAWGEGVAAGRWDPDLRCCEACGAGGHGCGGACAPRANAQALLGVRLPGPPSGAHNVGHASDTEEDSEDLSGSCCICYQYELAGQVPSMSCPGASCGRAFHAVCLSDYLQGSHATRRCYQTLFGSCPFCNAALSVRLD